MPNFSLVCPVAVAMKKLHSLPHMWLIIFTLLLGDHMPNFSLIGPLISFWQPKQLPMGVADHTTPINTPTCGQ